MKVFVVICHIAKLLTELLEFFIRMFDFIQISSVLSEIEIVSHSALGVEWSLATIHHPTPILSISLLLSSALQGAALPAKVVPRVKASFRLFPHLVVLAFHPLGLYCIFQLEQIVFIF